MESRGPKARMGGVKSLFNVQLIFACPRTETVKGRQYLKYHEMGMSETYAHSKTLVSILATFAQAGRIPWIEKLRWSPFLTRHRM